MPLDVLGRTRVTMTVAARIGYEIVTEDQTKTGVLELANCNYLS